MRERGNPGRVPRLEMVMGESEGVTPETRNLRFDLRFNVRHPALGPRDSVLNEAAGSDWLNDCGHCSLAKRHLIGHDNLVFVKPKST